MFNVTEIIPDAIEFSDLLVRCTAEMRLAMEDFRNFKKSKTLSDKLVALNTLESEGDTLHANCIKKLFSDCNDAVKKLIWTNIYEDMEDCADDCEGAAGIIESVIMKNL